MRHRPTDLARSLWIVLPFALASCGNPEIATTTSGTAGTAGTSGTGATGGTGGTMTGTGGEGATLVGGGGAMTTSTGTMTSDPCDGVKCDIDQHCENQMGMGACANTTCDMLKCEPTEICAPGPNGGSYCKDISCKSDLDCPATQYCKADICVDDTCAPGAATCSGQDVLVCLPNGSGEQTKVTCGSDAYFMSLCQGDGKGQASCTCEDDWDCPSNTDCDVSSCVGTGKAPTCSLPPVPFDKALPVNEIQWGGTSQAMKNAVGAPFPTSSQVSATPMVINLDDDNGDGLINERDFPEIVFMTYKNVDNIIATDSFKSRNSINDGSISETTSKG